MPVLHAIVLGLTQGLSEFLPISSSGHLRIVPWLFGWDDFTGNPGLHQTFDVSLHLGTFIGAVAYFRRDIVRLVTAGILALRPSRKGAAAMATTETSVEPAPLDVAGRPGLSDEARLAYLLLASAVPAGVVGSLLDDPISRLADHIWIIGFMLILFGAVLMWADRLGGRRSADDMRVRDAVIMGAAQAAALVPGVSRSGMTITAGRYVGFSRDSAARISFLMSLPITAGAIVFKGIDLLKAGMPEGFAAAFVCGIVASAISGFAAVWATLRLVRTRTFTPFVIYRFVVGTGVLLLAASGVR